MNCHNCRFRLTEFCERSISNEALLRPYQVRYSSCMSLLQKPEIIIATFHESEWELWRSTSVDGAECFAGSFQEWQTRCVEVFKERTRQGFAAQVVEITIADFVQWAKLNDRTPDAQARAEYAGLHCGQMYYI